MKHRKVLFYTRDINNIPYYPLGVGRVVITRDSSIAITVVRVARDIFHDSGCVVNANATNPSSAVRIARVRMLI